MVVMDANWRGRLTTAPNSRKIQVVELALAGRGPREDALGNDRTWQQLVPLFSRNASPLI